VKETVVISMLTIYLVGVVVTTSGAYVQSRLFRDDQMPPPQHPLGIALVAGLIWPVVVLGVVQFGLLAVAHRVMRRHVAATGPEELQTYDAAAEHTLISA
jgi:hypothetical protein